MSDRPKLGFARDDSKFRAGEHANEHALLKREVVEDLCRVAAKEAAQTAHDGLRALPVEQRMEAMGMEPSEEHWIVKTRPPVLWREANR